MKYRNYAVLTGAALLATLGQTCAAEDNVTIYGVLQDAVEQYHLSGADGSSRVSNAASNTSRAANYGSFMGFRGNETLDNDLSAIYQFESYVFLNGQQPAGFNAFGSRNTRVGLNSKQYGTVFFGVWDTPFRDLLSRVPFVGTTLDAGALMANGIGNTVANGQAPASFERRQTNTVAYWSPQVDGFQARVHYSLGNGDGTSTGNGPHLLSLRGSYTGGPVTLMTAYETHHDYGGSGTSDRGLALYGDVAIGQGKLGAILTNLSYQRVVNGSTGNLRVNNWTLFGNQKFGPGTVSMAYTRSGSGSGSLNGLVAAPSGQVSVNPVMFVGQATSGSQTGANMVEIGYAYNLSKRTNLFTNVMYLKNAAHGAYVPFGGIPAIPGALGVSHTVLAVGMLAIF